MKSDTQRSKTLQTVWGIALTLMAIAVFFRIPAVMERVATIPYFTTVLPLIRITFYLMVILLAGGGIRKLYGIYGPHEPTQKR